MISINEKSYILLTVRGKLKIHGSSLKGKHMPVVCDRFRDVLAHAVFNGVPTIKVFKQFRDLRGFGVKDFQVRIYPSKFDYAQNTLYSKLMQQLAVQGLKVVLGGSLEYVKIKGGYRPVLLFGGDDEVDYPYYKAKLAEIASLLLGKDAKSLKGLFESGQELLLACRYLQ